MRSRHTHETSPDLDRVDVLLLVVSDVLLGHPDKSRLERRFPWSMDVCIPAGMAGCRRNCILLWPVCPKRHHLHHAALPGLGAPIMREIMLPIRQNVDQLGPVAGPYSHAVIHGDAVYTSGLTAFGSNSQAGGAAAQTHTIVDQLSILAESCKTSLQHLIKVTIFAVDPADIPEIREVLSDRYGENVPASSLVFVKELFSPDLRLEIEAVFAVHPV